MTKVSDVGFILAGAAALCLAALPARPPRPRPFPAWRRALAAFVADLKLQETRP